MYGEYFIYIFISYTLFISVIIFGIIYSYFTYKSNLAKFNFLKKIKNEN